MPCLKNLKNLKDLLLVLANILIYNKLIIAEKVLKNY